MSNAALRSLLAVVIFNGLSLQAGLVTTNKNNRIDFSTNSSQFIVNSPLTIDATLGVHNSLDQIVSNADLTLNNAALDVSQAMIEQTGVLTNSPQRVVLLNNQTFFCGSPSQINGLAVRGANAVIAGSPLFTHPLVFETSASSASLQLSTDMTGSIIFAGGTLTLLAPLVMTGDAVISGSGTIIANYHPIDLAFSSRTLTDTWYLNSGVTLNLHQDMRCSGKLIFGPAHGTSTINGNGHVLDLNQTGTLWIRSGHGLMLRDLVLKGLGATNNGRILFEDVNATLSLDNVTLVLADHYTVTQGSIYVLNNFSNIQTGASILTFSQNGKLTVDGTVLSYDPIGFADNQNIRPTLDDGINRVSLRGGRIELRPDYIAASSLNFDSAYYTLTKNYAVTTAIPLNLRGSFASSVTINAGGMHLMFEQVKQPQLFVGAGKRGVIKNAVLLGLRPEHIYLAAGAELVFGDGVVIKPTESFDLSMTLTCDGRVVIDAAANHINLTTGAFRLNSQSELTIRCATISHVGRFAGNKPNIFMFDPSGRLVLDNSTVIFDDNFNFSQGSLDIKNTVVLSSSWATVAYTSTLPCTIKSQSSLFLDRGMTFSYDSASATKNGLIYEDASGLIYLRGTTLHTTWTGLNLTVGRMVVDEKTTFSSQARNEAESIYIANTFDLHVAAGSSLTVYGRVTYE